MSLTQLDYPVTGAVGTFMNIFPSQKLLNVNFQRLDVSISTIASGTGGVVELTLSAVLDSNLVDGDFVVWRSNGYSLRTSRILDVISTTVIEVDEVFVSSDATNGFMNYRKSWFLEARFVAANTPTDQQDNVELVIEDFAQVPNALDGSVVLDISIVKDVLVPAFSLTTEIATSLSKIFKFQFRESYDTNRNAAWISPNVAPANDSPIMLVLGSKEIVFNDFTDAGILRSKFAEKYPLMISSVYSDINDSGSNTLTFSLSQFKLNKELISITEIAAFVDVAGVINLFIDPNQYDDDTVFMQVTVAKTTSNAQYDPAQYDPAQYA